MNECVNGVEGVCGDSKCASRTLAVCVTPALLLGEHHRSVGGATENKVKLK